MTQETDVRITDHGTLVLFYPLTDTTWKWFAENVEVPDYMRTAEYIACEHRYAPDIIADLVDAGFNIHVR